jgi:7-cyano-7-deazaguanine synthase in queuosine biosynthesis
MNVVRYVGRRGSTAEYEEALRSDDYVVIDTLPDGANTTVRFELDGAKVQVNPPAPARDLLDMAVAVYIADELLARSSVKDEWTRAFSFLFPVRSADAWIAGRESLQRALATLAGDNYRFRFVPREKLSLYRRHRRKLPRAFDVVCLFSGGIDSYLGAHQLLASGRKVLLVGHQAEGITAAAQTALAEELRRQFPRAVALLQVRVARRQSADQRYPLPDKSEASHRPRSLLFLSLAIAVAAVLGIEEVTLPENGLMALNPPLQPSRVGTLSTRTAHPRFLGEFADFLAQAGVFTGTIRNPFIYQSKTDLLANLNPSLAAGVQRAVSCGHASNVRWVGKKGVHHCGYCVPCIHRRVAMMAAGMDDAGEYAFDVFRDLASLTRIRQLDFWALVRFAGRIKSMTAGQRAMLVLAHGYFPPEAGGRFGPAPTTDYSPWSEMLLRWADDFLEKVRMMSRPSTKRVVGLAPSRRKARAS